MGLDWVEKVGTDDKGWMHLRDRSSGLWEVAGKQV